jgi:4-carboxymuconolactone decarboxylase
MKKILYVMILFCAALTSKAVAQEASVFPKGEISTADNHTGAIWLNELSQPDSILNYSIAFATYAPGAKLDWHIHPAGQTLLITEGTGYYQEKGKPVQIIHKGDVIKCLPGVAHWHAASPGSDFAYIAVTPAQNGKTKWLQRVTDEEYKQVNYSAVSSRNAEQEIINLSKQKWLWMADKNADSLNALFDEKSVFVHMGGSWGKAQELNVIKSGGIWYKKADIHSVSVNIIGNTAILLNNITLLAVVGGNEVTNPFIVTEVYIKENGKWTLGSISFTKLLTQ